MDSSRKKRNSGRAVRITETAVAVCIAAILIAAYSRIGGQDSLSGRERLEDAVRRAAVSCYAEEGVYPPDVDYIRERYGVLIDEDRYTVHYNIFAENIMPVITVTEKEHA